MSLRRYLPLTLGLIICLSANAESAKAGPFMEGIAESVFKTAEKEFLDAFKPRTQPTPNKTSRPDARSATDAAAPCPKPIQRSPAPGLFRMFRAR